MILSVPKYVILLFLLELILIGCENPDDQVCEEDITELIDESAEHLTDEESDELVIDTMNNVINDTPCLLEEYIIEMGLVDVQSYNRNIMVDLRYSTTNNFLEKNLYGCLKKAYLQPIVAERLSKAQEYLQNKHPHLRLYIFDAVRPLNVQQKMWDALDTIPVNDRVKFVSNPKNGSIHNYGAAVDLSIYDTIKDTLLDMGAGFDDMRLIAYPKWEDKFLKSGDLSETHIANRKLLREVMRVGGFWVLPTEWWHFNAFSRDKSKELFELIDFTAEIKN
jgi:D-alanyl-D-alanine dipeptidase